MGARTRNLTRELEAAPPAPLEDVNVARSVWRTFRLENGYAGDAPLLTPPTGNVKMAKSAAPTYGLTLAPASMSGVNVCSWSTPLCRAACVLVTAGKGTMPSVQRARIVKTRFLAEHPRAFLAILRWELERAVAKHGRIVARLNVASDLRWERIAPWLFELPGVAFYDYTKAPVGQRDSTGNYRLTYSVSERAHSTGNALEAMRQLANAAVVFERTPAGLPATWHGFPVIDGDVSDDRTMDPPGSVVGLLAKGSARKVAGSEDGFIKPALAS